MCVYYHRYSLKLEKLNPGWGVTQSFVADSGQVVALNIMVWREQINYHILTTMMKDLTIEWLNVLYILQQLQLKQTGL